MFLVKICSFNRVSDVKVSSLRRLIYTIYKGMTNETSHPSGLKLLTTTSRYAQKDKRAPFENH